jgi:hypothetical protein
MDTAAATPDAGTHAPPPGTADEQFVDDVLRASFPASDPPSWWVGPDAPEPAPGPSPSSARGS